MRLLIAAVAFICVMMVGITACQKDTSQMSTAESISSEIEDKDSADINADNGNDNAATDTVSEEKTTVSKQTETTTSNTDPSENAELYDVGEFTVELPSGWKAFPQTDVFGEADENGNYPIDPSTIYISKEAEDEWDLFSKPYVLIKYYDENAQVLDSKDWYSEVEDLEAEIQGVKASPAFEGTSTLLEDQIWKYQILQGSLDGGQYVITITKMQNNKGTGLTYSDKDVSSILESIKTK